MGSLEVQEPPLTTSGRRPRLLFLITCLQYGGADAQLVSLAVGFRKRGWDVAVASMVAPKAVANQLEEGGIKVHSLGMLGGFPDPRGVLNLARLIQQWQPDVVHSHMVHANILARVTRLFTPMRKLICTAHNLRETSERGGGTWHKELMYRLTDPMADHTTIISHAAFDRYVAVKAVPRHKFSVVPNGVDAERFAPSLEVRTLARRELGYRNEFVWMAVGRMVVQKDYPSLLRAIARLRETNAVLLLVGKGPLLDELTAYAASLGVADRVRFAGVRQDLTGWYNAADAFVMSSEFEGLSVALLEAAAIGLPCVVTDVGGNSEVVLDGINGFVVPPQNSDALATAMERLMTLPANELRQFGMASRDHCLSRFSLQQVITQWETLYACTASSLKGRNHLHAVAGRS
jgi:glycosyltransferase involved in cell wall biosynthesis